MKEAECHGGQNEKFHRAGIAQDERRSATLNSCPMNKQFATLTSVQLVDIHGSRFYDIAFALENGRAKSGRLGVESVYPDPKVGDRISVSLLLGQVTSIEKAA